MRICGTGSALPEREITNDDLAQFLDTSDEWISTRTGIRTRRVLTTERLTDLAIAAAQSALEDAGLSADALDGILCSVVQAEASTPALACIIEGAIGANCQSMDINAGCTGFLAALNLADGLLASGKARHILVVAAEAMTRMCDWSDRSSCVLFGDGAGAAVVSAEEGLLDIHLTNQSNVEYLNAYTAAGNSPFAIDPPDHTYMHMNGQEVYKFAVSQSLKGIQETLKRTSLSPEDIDHYVLHQANFRILEAVRARLKVSQEKFPHNIEKRGNTSSASIPILLDELNRSGRLRDGDRLVLSAFGAGLSTGTAVLTWHETQSVTIQSRTE